ncbi:MAG: AraC family transcriptional regulator [Granulosicoccus sp.]
MSTKLVVRWTGVVEQARGGTKMDSRPGYESVRRTTRQEYEKRMRQVTDYVFEHLDEQLDLNRLAEIACMSPYHWHRVYQGLIGETLAATVKRLRLQRAADSLANSTRSIQSIARISGYSGVPAFNRAFKLAYNTTPFRYRDEGAHKKFRTGAGNQTGSTFAVEIRTINSEELLVMPHVGDYLEIDRAFTGLVTALGGASVLPQSTRMIGVYFDDPDFTESAKLESLACVVRANAEPVTPAKPTEVPLVDAPLEAYTLPGGRCAMLRYEGPYADMQAAYSWLYGCWLVDSGYEADDRPVFEEYLNDPRSTHPTELLTDIYLPLCD